MPDGGGSRSCSAGILRASKKGSSYELGCGSQPIGAASTFAGLSGFGLVFADWRSAPTSVVVPSMTLNPTNAACRNSKLCMGAVAQKAATPKAIDETKRSEAMFKSLEVS